MQVVILMILRVLFILFAVLAVLLVLLMSVRVGIEIVGVTGAVTVDVRYGFLRIPIYPWRSKPDEKESAAPPQKERRDKPASTSRLNWRGLSIDEIIHLARTILEEMSASMRIARLHVRIVVGSTDAATTGIRLGQIAAACGMILPFLENTFDVKDCHVRADADFDADHTEWAVSALGSVRPIQLIFIILRHGREMYRIFKILTKKEEAIFDEPAPNQ